MDPVSATITVVKVANSIHKMNEDRSRQKLAATELQSDPRAISLAKEDQINEVLLVLATLGERLMVLGVINARYANDILLAPLALRNECRPEFGLLMLTGMQILPINSCGRRICHEVMRQSRCA